MGQARRRIEVVTSSTQGQHDGLPAGAAVSPYDPVFGPGFNLGDSALDAYGEPYQIAGAPVAEAHPRIAPDAKTAKPRAKKKRPPVETSGLDLDDVTPVPFVDDQGHTFVNRKGQQMMRPAGMDLHFFVAEGLKIRASHGPHRMFCV